MGKMTLLQYPRESPSFSMADTPPIRVKIAGWEIQGYTRTRAQVRVSHPCQSPASLEQKSPGEVATCIHSPLDDLNRLFTTRAACKGNFDRRGAMCNKTSGRGNSLEQLRLDERFRFSRETKIRWI